MSYSCSMTISALANPSSISPIFACHPRGDIGRLIRCRLDALGEHLLVQDRCVGLHRIDDVDDMRQDFVIDFDQLQRRSRDGFAGRRHRGHRVPVIHRLFAGHHVAGDIVEIDDQLARRRGFVRQIGKIVAGDDRLDAGQRFSAFVVSMDLMIRVGVGAAQNLADQLSGQIVIGRIAGGTGYLVDRVVALLRIGADDFKVLVLVGKRRRER